MFFNEKRDKVFKLCIYFHQITSTSRINLGDSPHLWQEIFVAVCLPMFPSSTAPWLSYFALTLHNKINSLKNIGIVLRKKTYSREVLRL